MFHFVLLFSFLMYFPEVKYTSLDICDSFSWNSQDPKSNSLEGVRFSELHKDILVKEK